MTGRLTMIEALALVLTALATGVALLWAPTAVCLGIAAGGALGVANFYALRRLMLAIIGAAQRGSSPPRQALLVTLLMLKFGAMAVAVYLVLTKLPVSGLGLLGGISCVVIAIFVEGARTVWRAHQATGSTDA